MTHFLNNIQPSVVPIRKGQQPVLLNDNSTTDFASILKNSIDKVNESQIRSNEKTEALATGKIDNLHDVMITAQKASITLETSVQIQRKVIDAYNEIMRMQV